jgi:hypothetical protein
MSNEEPQFQGKGKKREAVKQSFRQGMQSIGARWDKFRGKSRSPASTRSATPQHTELPPSNAAGSSQGRGRFLDVPHQYPDFLEPPVQGMLTPRMLCHIVERVDGLDHTIQHGPTPLPLDLELIEERERLAKDLPERTIPQAPNRESSRLSLILRRLTVDTAAPPKEAVSSSNHPSQGVFSSIANRYHFPSLV